MQNDIFAVAAQLSFDSNSNCKSVLINMSYIDTVVRLLISVNLIA